MNIEERKKQDVLRLDSRPDSQASSVINTTVHSEAELWPAECHTRKIEERRIFFDKQPPACFEYQSRIRLVYFFLYSIYITHN